MIVAAAIDFGGLVCSMAKPARHHDILRRIVRNFGEKRTDLGYLNERQGFMTDAGEFLTREEAYRHACECGQGTPRRMQLLTDNPRTYNGMDLFSEDLW